MKRFLLLSVLNFMFKILYRQIRIIKGSEIDMTDLLSQRSVAVPTNSLTWTEQNLCKYLLLQIHAKWSCSKFASQATWGQHGEAGSSTGYISFCCDKFIKILGDQFSCDVTNQGDKSYVSLCVLQLLNTDTNKYKWARMVSALVGCSRITEKNQFILFL